MKSKMLNFFKILFKFTTYTLLSFIIFVILYFISSYFLSQITINEEQNDKDEVAIYIKTNGVHTDIVMPIQNEINDWSKQVKIEHTISKDSTYQYVAMGWGDKGFYLQTPTWSDLFKAATGLSSTAIHTTFYKNINEDSTCKKILISKNQYTQLTNYINNSFQKDKKGNFLKINTNANYGSNDVFYEANGSYSLFHTCNTWANNSLKASGQKCCLWTPFDTGIFLKYK